MSQHEALILAGPNGAGKTTASTTLVPAGVHFLNSDVITAQLLHDGHPQRGVETAAGRIVLEQLRGLVADGESFCIETNLAGRGFVRWINDWHARSYTVRMIFTALESPELAVGRVAARVASGGHDVDEGVVRRRWASGLHSFFDVYLAVVDDWTLFDNSERDLRQVATGTLGAEPRVVDQERWALLRSSVP